MLGSRFLFSLFFRFSKAGIFTVVPLWFVFSFVVVQVGGVVGAIVCYRPAEAGEISGHCGRFLVVSVGVRVNSYFSVLAFSVLLYRL